MKFSARLPCKYRLGQRLLSYRRNTALAVWNNSSPRHKQDGNLLSPSKAPCPENSWSKQARPRAAGRKKEEPRVPPGSTGWVGDPAGGGSLDTSQSPHPWGRSLPQASSILEGAISLQNTEVTETWAPGATSQANTTREVPVTTGWKQTTPHLVSKNYLNLHATPPGALKSSLPFLNRFIKSHEPYYRKKKLQRLSAKLLRLQGSHPPSYFHIPTIPSLYLFLLHFLPLGPKQAIEPGLNMPKKNLRLDMAKIMVSNETKQKAKMK